MFEEEWQQIIKYMSQDINLDQFLKRLNDETSAKPAVAAQVKFSYNS